MARLRIVFRGTETSVPLRDERITVGRASGCTIHVPDPELAELHFRIDRREGGYRLRDDGSGLGTRVNGKPVYGTRLRDGDVIEAGGLRCLFFERDEDAAPPPPRPPRPAKRSAAPAVVAGAILAVAAATFLLLSGGDDAERALWDRANAHLRASRERPADATQELGAAVGALEALLRAGPGRNLAASASAALEEARRAHEALADLDAEERGIEALRDGAAEDDAFARLARLRASSAHPAVAVRAEAVESALRARRAQRQERIVAEAAARAGALAGEKRWAEALAVWNGVEAGDFHVRQRVERARLELEQRIEQEYRSLLSLAERGDDLDARIALLEASRPVFRGTMHASDLEVRISALRARRSRPDLPEPEAGKPDEEPEPLDTGPYRDPPEVAALVAARRYGEAAAALHRASRHPLAAVRVLELTRAAEALAALQAEVAKSPVDYGGVPLTDGSRGDVLIADTATVLLRTPAGEVRVPWGELPAGALARMLMRAGMSRKPDVGTALLYDELGLSEDAERLYVAYLRREPPPAERATFSRILARRRGIEPPPGGFVVFRDRVMTPAEQERLVLRERIDRLASQARSATERTRLEAWRELEEIGAPARAVLVAAVAERRDKVAEEMAGHTAFSPQRLAAIMARELPQRRREALDFILDANRYPYPNNLPDSQAEAERLARRVEELYEEPYGFLVAASDTARALDAELEALDARLLALDPSAEPLLSAAIGNIVARLEPDRIAIDDRDRDRLEYNRKVAEYNARLETSADEEERANVAAVNRYRGRMGLNALKIDERLLRAARKHSIEMRQLGYFEHDSPTAALKTPDMRARREGYGGGVGENIARGPATGQAAFEAWFTSSGHHRNMLRPGWTEMGCGQSNRHWWTQLFGAATGKSLDPPSVPPDPDPPGTSGNGMPPPG